MVVYNKRGGRSGRFPCIWIQRWTLRKREIFAGTCEAEAINNFAAQQVIRNTHVQWLAATHIASHIFCLPVFSIFFPLLSGLHKHTFYHNFSPQKNGVEVISRFDGSYLTNRNQASVGHFACFKQWRNKRCTAQSRQAQPHKKTNRAHLKLGCRLRQGRVIHDHLEIRILSSSS